MILIVVLILRMLSWVSAFKQTLIVLPLALCADKKSGILTMRSLILDPYVHLVWVGAGADAALKTCIIMLLCCGPYP